MPQLDCIIDISSLMYQDWTFIFLTNFLLFLLVSGSNIYPLPQIENPGVIFDSFSLSSNTQSVAKPIASNLSQFY